VDIHYIRQREPRGLGDAILTAEKHVGDEPFLVMLGDTINVAKVPVAKQLMDVHAALGSSVIAIERVRREKISSYGIVAGTMKQVRLMLIRELVEKPQAEDAPSDLGISGTYVLTPRIFDCVRRTQPNAGNEVQLTDALRLLSQEEPIYGYLFEGRRYDIGTKLDWILAHLELSLARDEFREPLMAFMRERLRGA